jgi:hypothetical protein
MKKTLLTLTMLVSLCTALSAQQMTFEETVKYIRDKMECCRDRSFYREVESVNKDGKIKVIMGSEGSRTFDLFELFPRDTTQTGIAQGTSPNSLWYQGQLIFLFETEADGKRMYNALKHLATVCERPRDPFD